MTLFAIKERSEGVTSNNNSPFLRMTMANKDGSIQGVYWGVPDEVKAFCQVGVVIDVNGERGEYKGEPQIKISACYYVAPSEIRYEDLLPVSPYRESAEQRFAALIEAQTGPIGEFLRRAFWDEVFIQRYRTWPASVMYHHAYLGGLLQHSTEVAEIALSIARSWPGITDRGIIVAGALLHDVGKLQEIRLGACFEFTDEGLLLGHVAQGMRWLEQQRPTSGLAPETFAELAHIIASHHGAKENGALTEPKTANALAVHLADLASARMEAARNAITAHKGPESWTAYDRATGTQYLVRKEAGA